MRNVTVELVKVRSGRDCWGRPEYDYRYLVKNENGYVIYSSADDPTPLIKALSKES